jgi:hypothetical protein
MAAPFVSGAAALYFSRFPSNSLQQAKNALLQSVDVSPSFAGKTVTGGRINVGKALGAGRGTSAPAAAPVQGDQTPPSAFRLVRPRDHYRSRRHGLKFRWQRSHDQTGIHFYRLFVDGKHRKTVRDPDGPGGKDPRARTRFRLANGRHRWFVRAYDYAGNSRTSASARGTKRSRARSLLFVRSR